MNRQSVAGKGTTGKGTIGNGTTGKGTTGARPLGARIVGASLLMLLGLAAAQAADTASGLAVARRLCVNCHTVEPGGAKAEITAGVPAFIDVANKPGQTEDKLKAFMLNPHPPMPQMQLTTHELDNLAAYISSLKSK